MKQAIKALVSGALIIIAIYILDIHALIKIMGDGSAVSFTVAVIINILIFLVLAARWVILITPTTRLSFLKHTEFYFKGAFLNTFTPANFGGDAYRLAALRKNTVSSGALVKVLLRERMMGFYGYVIVFIVAFIFVSRSMDFNTPLAENPYAYGAIVALMVFSLPFIAKPLGARVASTLRGIIGRERLPKLESYVESFAGILSLKGAFPLIFLTFCGIALWVASIKIIAEGFGVSIPLTHLAAVAMLVEVIRLVPVTIQGIGLREGAFAYLLAFLGHNPEQCFVIGTVAYLALSVAIILSGPIGYALMWCDQSNE